MTGTASLVIRAGRLLDGTGAPVRKNVDIMVSGGRIVAVTDAVSGQTAPSRLVDLGHCTVLPSLADCSVGLGDSPSVAGCRGEDFAGQPTGQEKIERHLADCLAHGVLIVFAHDLSPGQAARWSAKQDVRVFSGAVAGDPVRICLSGDIDSSAEEPVPDEAAADLTFVKEQGKKVVVVANGPHRVEQALDLGCDAIEQGYGMGRENLLRMARQGVTWIPALIRARNGLDGAVGGGSVCCRFSTRYAPPGQGDPRARKHWQRLLADQLALLGEARRLGVVTAMGTGAGHPGILPGEALAEEVRLFLRAGYPLAEAICSATRNGARLLGCPDLGRISPGFSATFVATRGTVSQLARKLSFLHAVFAHGRRVAF